MATDADQPPRETQDSTQSSVELRLRGAIPCIRCNYELQGLSVRAECPECGSPVLASVLRVVDPQASEVAEIRRPSILAPGLITWSAGWSLATLSAVVFAAWDLVPGGSREVSIWSARLALLGMIAATLGSFTLVRPLANHLALIRTTAAPAALCHAMTTTLLAIYIYQTDRIAGIPTIALTLALASASMLLIRGRLRDIESRSLIFRRGEVSRQRALPIGFALAVMAIASASHPLLAQLGSPAETAARIIESTVVTIGLVLCLIGFVGVNRDIAKVIPSITRPTISAATSITPSGEEDA